MLTLSARNNPGGKASGGDHEAEAAHGHHDGDRVAAAAEVIQMSARRRVLQRARHANETARREALRIGSLDEASSNFEKRARKLHEAAWSGAGGGRPQSAADGPFHKNRRRADVYEELLLGRAMVGSPTANEAASSANRLRAIVGLARRAQLELPAAGGKSGCLVLSAAERARARASAISHHTSPREPPVWWGWPTPLQS
jgi:hypothetical protein